MLRRPNLEVEVQNQEVFLLAGKNTEIVLVPCSTWKCVSTAISSGIDISEVPWVSFVATDEFSVRVTEIDSWIGV